MILTFGISLLLVAISAICSGLNLALMSLDLANLERLSAQGNAAAKKVLPLRKNAHLSLASIVFTNVAVVSASSLVLDRVFSGLVAGIVSTLIIVVFGEILPQALFARRALAVSARLAPVLKFMIAVTFPITKPLQIMLDRLFGHELTRLHSRKELGMIVTEHLGHTAGELDEDEVEIIKGALMLSEKKVSEIMTPIKKTYWLTPTTLIDASKIDELKEQSWSRVPILSDDLSISYGLLLLKDLVDIDFDEQSQKVSELRLRRTREVGSNTALDTLFRIFIGAKTHMLMVTRDRKVVGIVTIEDLLEEILQHEIEDESDE